MVIPILYYKFVSMIKIFNTVANLKSDLKQYKIAYMNSNETIERFKKIICCKNEEIERLEKELKEAKDLKEILETLSLGNSNCITYSGSGGICLTMNGDHINFKLTDDIPQYVEDIFDSSKKVIKQESNLGIQIDKEGNVTTGRTKLPCDKNRNYKLKQI